MCVCVCVLPPPLSLSLSHSLPSWSPLQVVDEKVQALVREYFTSERTRAAPVKPLPAAVTTTPVSLASLSGLKLHRRRPLAHAHGSNSGSNSGRNRGGRSVQVATHIDGARQRRRASARKSSKRRSSSSSSSSSSSKAAGNSGDGWWKGVLSDGDDDDDNLSTSDEEGDEAEAMGGSEAGASASGSGDEGEPAGQQRYSSDDDSVDEDADDPMAVESDEGGLDDNDGDDDDDDGLAAAKKGKRRRVFASGTVRKRSKSGSGKLGDRQDEEVKEEEEEEEEEFVPTAGESDNDERDARAVLNDHGDDTIAAASKAPRVQDIDAAALQGAVTAHVRARLARERRVALDELQCRAPPQPLPSLHAPAVGGAACGGDGDGGTALAAYGAALAALDAEDLLAVEAAAQAVLQSSGRGDGQLPGAGSGGVEGGDEGQGRVVLSDADWYQVDILPVLLRSHSRKAAEVCPCVCLCVCVSACMCVVSVYVCVSCLRLCTCVCVHVCRVCVCIKLVGGTFCTMVYLTPIDGGCVCVFQDWSHEVHSAGCARTQGYYFVEASHKKKKLTAGQAFHHAKLPRAWVVCPERVCVCK